MSAKEHDHDHDHAHPHTHEDQPQAALPATPEHGYWKSLRELDGKAPWQLEPSTREFAPGADEPPLVDPMSRRNFFNLMGGTIFTESLKGFEKRLNKAFATSVRDLMSDDPVSGEGAVSVALDGYGFRWLRVRPAGDLAIP